MMLGTDLSRAWIYLGDGKTGRCGMEIKSGKVFDLILALDQVTEGYRD